MHRLSSLSKPPVAARASTPRRAAAAAPGPATPLTTPSQLMRGLPQQISTPAVKREEDGGSPARPMGILARAPPLRDVPPLAGEDGAEEGEEAELWSPKKKKGGYLVSGMAARASAVLAATRTDHTLWLHDMSRRLASASSSSATSTSVAGGLMLDELAQALKPAIRLVVVDVPSSALGDEPGAGASSTVSDRRRGAAQKTVLARCRIVLPPSITRPPTSTPPPETDDLVGLVLFSLHERSGATSSAASSVPPPPPAPPPPPSSPSKRTTTSRTRPRSLVIPTVPPDLRWVRPGAEVWVWDPYREVVLPRDEEGGDWRMRGRERERRGAGQGERAGVIKQDEDEDEQEEGPRVEWDGAARAQSRTAGAAREQEGTTRALVCGRFGVVV
ncbi:hypothetical protein JCM9279_003785 [Rhodotorula babjevae]